MFDQSLFLAVASAISGAISTVLVTKIKSNKETQLAELNTESSRVSLYMDKMIVLLENAQDQLGHAQEQINVLKEEITILRAENKELRRINEEFTSTVAKLTGEITILKDELARVKNK